MTGILPAWIMRGARLSMACFLICGCQSKTVNEPALMEGTWIFHKWELGGSHPDDFRNAEVNLLADEKMNYSLVPRPDGFGGYTFLTGSGSWKMIERQRKPKLELFHRDQQYIQTVEIFGKDGSMMRFVLDVDTGEGLVLHRK